MYRPTAVQFSDKMPVAKRRGRKFRRFDPVTARMSPWFSDAPKTDPAPTFERMTVAELRALAAERGLKLPSKARKAELVDALSNR